MKCICGYSDIGVAKGPPLDINDIRDPFIPISFVERGPFHAVSDGGHGPSTGALKAGAPVQAYACPKCGTVRIEP